ncbi:sigma-54 dependent transcriptional regulator [Clostridium sp. CX1]|uniref:sigma-54-dependent transcriptional regulator n=1 Tax=Clostridium sp. CX1 TaxID=2978346 RepID=UPI0021C01C87|nr:sigma-54 dependent transcriptional regulator [Clostridium sp. CX1]MCT8976180.1 sigma-54 dependent transcriptional regulator [Clostridium sp. CX1]
MNFKDNFKILIVDDEVDYLNSMKKLLDEKDYNSEIVLSGTEAVRKLKQESYNLVITGLRMPEMNGIELTEKIKKDFSNIEVIILTSYGSIETAVQAMKKGAFSYFVRDNGAEELLMEIEKIRKFWKLKYENEFLRNQQNSTSYILQTYNEKYKDILNIVRKAAQSNVNILITGESGVGKEVLARYVHEISERRQQHFVAVNCQALSENLLESELFGHEKGSFTGALERRIGRFQQANGGTLFLDEIGEMPVNVQIKLLRVLESRTIEMLGSNKSINVDIRLISATNKDLENAIIEGVFREDLFYRINTIILEVPPLRERKEDLNMLIEFFLRKCEKEQKKKIVKVEKDVIEFLLSYNYPGNIRELRNIIERLVVLSENGVIRFEDLPQRKKTTISDVSKVEDVVSLRDFRKDIEKDYIVKILDKCEGNISKAAECLQISKRQLFNKIAEYDIK